MNNVQLLVFKHHKAFSWLNLNVINKHDLKYILCKLHPCVYIDESREKLNIFQAFRAHSSQLIKIDYLPVFVHFRDKVVISSIPFISYRINLKIVKITECNKRKSFCTTHYCERSDKIDEAS